MNVLMADIVVVAPFAGVIVGALRQLRRRTVSKNDATRLIFQLPCKVFVVINAL
jgi:hypothetical protein